ncbi:MAG: zinc ribbon domain-containing protein [Candidatus Hydrogenedentes bacterium]|nr:zinc ribbon domain-containing protein [Candidatus Hydrogenedentota bacterium]
MPTYEYECQRCGKRFERFQNMTDEPLQTCPDCGGSVRRLIGSGAGIIFKGSGFYATDYQHNSRTNTRCGRDKPCCGRDTPCDTKPCEK